MKGIKVAKMSKIARVVALLAIVVGVSLVKNSRRSPAPPGAGPLSQAKEQSSVKPKVAVTVVLLALACASLAFLLIAGCGKRSTPDTGPEALVGAPRAGPEVAGFPDTSPQTASTKIIVYYFHGTMRCATCLNIEDYAREAVLHGFGDALAAGRLEWRTVDVEEAENQHFLQDFKVATRSLVVVQTRDGKQIAWKNLLDIWDLVGDKLAFTSYVQDEVRSWLENSL